jgi:hypothetical protein
MKFAKPTHSRKSVQLHSAEPDITAALLKDSQEISPSKPKTRRSHNDYSNDDSDESKSNEFSLRFLIMIRHFTILPVGIFNHVAELEAIVHLVHWTSHRRWPLVVGYSMFAALFGTSMATPIAPLTAAVAQPQHCDAGAVAASMLARTPGPLALSVGATVCGRISSVPDPIAFDGLWAQRWFKIAHSAAILLVGLAWVRLAAVDVALTETPIGSGMTGMLLIGAAARLGGTQAAAVRSGIHFGR